MTPQISSTDGNSCSGGTPDIVWESFQKKGCAKLWHAKRFSCKIDGVEVHPFFFPSSFSQITHSIFSRKASMLDPDRLGYSALVCSENLDIQLSCNAVVFYMPFA